MTRDARVPGTYRARLLRSLNIALISYIEPGFNLFRNLVEVPSFPLKLTGVRKLQIESIIRNAGNDMEVYMKNLLASRSTICKKEIDSVAGQARVADSRANFRCNNEHTCSSLFIQVIQPFCMLIWDDQYMAWIDGLDVHERGYKIITVDK